MWEIALVEIGIVSVVIYQCILKPKMFISTMCVEQYLTRPKCAWIHWDINTIMLISVTCLTVVVTLTMDMMGDKLIWNEH